MPEKKTNLLDKFLFAIKKYDMLDMNNKIIIGVSGGADSVCLLNLFLNIKKNFGLEIIVAHLNHGLRGAEADRDELFVKNLCLDKKIIFESKKINIKNLSLEKKINIEQAGRMSRYRFFFELLKKYDADKIATAHNKNDDIETILFKLIRGCGLNGLSGIKINNKNKIIRPLIDITRHEIESYCNENKIKYIIDSSNLDYSYARNKIRNKIIPVMLEINSGFINNFKRSIDIIVKENVFLEQKAIEFINKLEDKNKILIKKIKNVPKILASKIIYLIIKNIVKNNFEYKHVNLVLDLINKQNKKIVCLPNNICAKRVFDKIIFYDNNNKLIDQAKNDFELEIELDKLIFISRIKKFLLVTDKDYCDNINIDLNNNNNSGQKNIFLPLLYKKVFYYDNINQMILRDYKNNDKIFFEGVGHKKLKKLLSEKKICPDLNKFVWVLVINNNDIVWIFGENINIISNDNRYKNKYYIYVFGGKNYEGY